MWAAWAVAVAGACALDAPGRLVLDEGFVDPLGFHNPSPRFSWRLPDGVRRQAAWRIEVRDADTGKLLWDSRVRRSDQSVRIPYDGLPLRSRQRAAWRVACLSDSGEQSDWSEPADFEMGLLSTDDWKGSWIRPRKDMDTQLEAVCCLRREFTVKGAVKQARLYATARGIFEPRLNGERVGEDYFLPGWTSYSKRVDTLTYDVTDRLTEGPNVLGAILGSGWYAGRIGWKHEAGYYFGQHPDLLMQLEIVYEDGRRQLVVTDRNWKSTWDGPVRTSSYYDGERYEAAREMPGWDAAGFIPRGWDAVREAAIGDVELRPKPFAPVRRTGVLHPVEVMEPEPGRFIFDLGQNMVGWARVRIPVEQGREVKIRFAEAMSSNTLYVANLRSAKCTDCYLPAQTGEIDWEPIFTYHGFRFVELTGLPAGVAASASWVEGVVLGTDLRPTGSFESSHPKLNRLQRNIVWGQRGNFFDVPLDCPQRDERFGWTGDAQVFCSTALFNYDCHAFFKSWLGSLRDDQFDDGSLPHVAPSVRPGGSPGWQDAAAIVPWEIYLRCGDRDVLRENYDMVEGLVGWYEKKAGKGELLTPKMIGGYGDWLQPYAAAANGDTERDYLGNAFYINSAQLQWKMAEVLGLDREQVECRRRVEALKKEFADHYFDSEGRLKEGRETQTAYLLAFAFDLLPDVLKQGAEDRLVELIQEEAGGHLRTGFLGTPHIAPVLDRLGRSDLALDLLFKESYPSWFFSIDQGATTLWERWDAYSHENGFGPSGTGSLNHYAYGAVGCWMVERLAGIRPDPADPGYRHFFIDPLIAEQLDWVSARLDTPYGLIESRWKKLPDGQVEMSVTVPPNTRATIVPPNGATPRTVPHGTYDFTVNLSERREAGP